MLYFCVMLSAFHCSMGHGQMSGMQLNGVNVAFCSIDGPAFSSIDLASELTAPSASASFDCSLVSSFVALALAAFFGLLGWLPLRRDQVVFRSLIVAKPRRLPWLPANPRAPPFFA